MRVFESQSETRFAKHYNLVVWRFQVKEKEICKNVTKKILFIILNKNGFFCVRKLQKEVQKDRKTYTPGIPSDEPFFVRSQAKKPGNKKYIPGGNKND